MHVVFFTTLHWSATHHKPAISFNSVRVRLTAISRPAPSQPGTLTGGSTGTEKAIQAKPSARKPVKVKKRAGKKGKKTRVASRTGPSSSVLDILKEIGEGGASTSSSSIFSSLTAGGAEARSTSGESSIDSAVWSRYADSVWRLVHSRWRPPPGEGEEAVIVVVLNPDGSIKQVYVEKSSGFVSYDSRALEAVRKSAPFPPPPGGQSVELAFRFIR